MYFEKLSQKRRKLTQWHRMMLLNCGKWFLIDQFGTIDRKIVRLRQSYPRYVFSAAAFRYGRITICWQHPHPLL